MKYENGDTYVGMFKDGMKDGEGVFFYNASSIYSEISDLILEDKYEGRFRKDQRNGFGKMTYSTGDSYEGDWMSD
jgi:hypothetical protein